MNEYYILNIIRAEYNSPIIDILEIFYSQKHAIEYAIDFYIRDNRDFVYETMKERLTKEFEDKEVSLKEYVNYYKKKIKNVEELENFFSSFDMDYGEGWIVNIKKKEVRDEKEMNEKCKKIQRVIRNKIKIKNQ